MRADKLHHRLTLRSQPVDATGGWIVRQCRVLQARSEGSVLRYSTRAASAARREIAREMPPSVVFYETAVNSMLKNCLL